MPNNISSNFSDVMKLIAYIVALQDQEQLGAVYPVLKFYKAGVNSTVTHSGRRDMDALMVFIDEQMGRAPAKYVVRNKAYWVDI